MNTRSRSPLVFFASTLVSLPMLNSALTVSEAPLDWRCVARLWMLPTERKIRPARLSPATRSAARTHAAGVDVTANIVVS